MDAEFANQLTADLRAAGHACWIDTSALKGGDEWIMTIAEGIINSYVMLVVVTRAALQSRWVQNEILWARQKNKLIIPLMLENAFGETRFFPLASYQAEVFYEKDYAEALARLPHALPSPILAEVASEAAPLVEADSVSKPSASLPRSVPRTLELAYLERLRLEELLNTEKYTPVGGTSQQKPQRAEMRAVFELLPMSKDRELRPETRRFENAVEEIRHIRRAVLLGEPGGGKTTTLQHKDKYPEVQRFIQQHPRLLSVVSCRELDYTIDLGFDLINITQLDPLRIREFAGRYLDEEQGEALFWKLAGQAARGTHDQFMRQLGGKLAEPERIFWIESHIPENIPGVGWGWSKDTDWYWREWIRFRETPSSLMVLARNPYMLLMLTSVYAEQGTLPENRGELFQLFVQTLLKRERILADEQTPLIEGLARVAYEMQITI